MAAAEFTLFPQLPYDLRYRIWQLTLPYRDLKVGTRDTSDSFFHNTPAMDVPLTLRVCRESRAVACAHGRFIEVPRDPSIWDDTASVWFDRIIRTAYLPRDVSSLRTLQWTGCRASAVACLAPHVADVKSLHRFLASHRDDAHLSGIKTLYFALSGIVYGGGTPDPSDTRMYPPYQGSEVCVLTLDDDRVLPLLKAAFDKEKEDNPSGLIYHQTPTCFLNRLHAYWATYPQVKEIQANHDAKASEVDPSDPTLLLPLRPAIVFGKTQKTLLGSRKRPDLLHERQYGLVFKASDAPQLNMAWRGASAMRYNYNRLSRKEYDCKNRCCIAPGAAFVQNSRPGSS